MNENLPRWVFASLSKYLEGQVKNYKFRVEGEDRGAGNDSLELRIDGPNMVESTVGEQYFDVFVNILVMSVRDERDTHKHQKAVGVAAAALTGDIPLLKYGDGDQQIGCMIRRERVDITNFGTVEGRPNLVFSTVETKYCFTLT